MYPCCGRVSASESQPQRSWLLTAGAPFAAGTVAWVLWLPVARLIAAVEPDVLEGLLVALAQWGLTVLSAVWIVVLLAQQAEASAGRAPPGHMPGHLVIFLSLLLLIVAYVQQVSLLLRGLTFLSVGVILLFSTVGRRWLPFGQRGAGPEHRRYGGMRSTGMDTGNTRRGNGSRQHTGSVAAALRPLADPAGSWLSSPGLPSWSHSPT